MASTSVQPSFAKDAFLSSASHPDLASPQLVDSLIRHKLDTSDQLILSFKKLLRKEQDRNRILEAQVVGLEAVIAQLLTQAEQYNYEALVNEKRVKELEAKLDREVSKRIAHVKTAKKLENTVDRVRTLEKQLKVQVDIRANETMSDDQLGWSVVENSTLRTKVVDLEKELAHQKHQSRIASSGSIPVDQSLTEDVAASVLELSLVKDRLAMDLKFSSSESGPCEEYAACAVENHALKTQIQDLVGVQAIKDVADLQSVIQSEAVHEQIEQLKLLEAQYSNLSAACFELEHRRAANLVESSNVQFSMHSVTYPDEQLAYALVENRLLKESFDRSSN
jgi:hypothetical protein